MSTSQTREPFIHLAAGVAIVIVILVATWSQPARRGCWDFYQFWLTGRSVAIDAVDDVYVYTERERLARVGVDEAVAEAALRQVTNRRLVAAKSRPVLQNYSTPLLYTVFGITSTGHYDTDLDRFRRVSTVVYVLGILLLGSSLGYGWLRLIVVTVLLVFAFLPAYSDVVQGNVNRAQVGTLAFALMLGRPGVRGSSIAIGAALVGFATTFKPNTVWASLVLIAIPLLAHDWHRTMLRIGGIASGVMIGILLSTAFFGSYHPWIAWVGRLRDLHLEQFPASHGNTALPQWLLESTGLRLIPVLVVVFFGLVGFWLLLSRRVLLVPTADRLNAHNPRKMFLAEVAGAGLGSALPLFTSPLAWAHYHTFSILMVLYLLRPRVSADVQLSALSKRALQITSIYALLMMCVPLGITVISGSMLLFGLIVIEMMLFAKTARSTTFEDSHGRLLAHSTKEAGT